MQKYSSYVSCGFSAFFHDTWLFAGTPSSYVVNFVFHTHTRWETVGPTKGSSDGFLPPAAVTRRVARMLARSTRGPSTRKEEKKKPAAHARRNQPYSSKLAAVDPKLHHQPAPTTFQEKPEKLRDHSSTNAQGTLFWCPHELRVCLHIYLHHRHFHATPNILSCLLCELLTG